jgi:hypothetical protein
MAEASVLGILTEVAGKQSDMLFALLNFYGLVVLAVVGWLVNTAKDSAGISWFRILLFNLGFLAFFTATFGGFWYLYGQLSQTVAAWRAAAAATGAIAPEQLNALAWLPPQKWLFGLWGFNAVMLLLATVVLRRGGGGR